MSRLGVSVPEAVELAGTAEAGGGDGGIAWPPEYASERLRQTKLFGSPSNYHLLLWLLKILESVDNRSSGFKFIYGFVHIFLK